MSDGELIMETTDDGQVNWRITINGNPVKPLRMETEFMQSRDSFMLKFEIPAEAFYYYGA